VVSSTVYHKYSVCGIVGVLSYGHVHLLHLLPRKDDMDSKAVWPTFIYETIALI